MSHPLPATLYRIAAVAGCGSAAVLLINAAILGSREVPKMPLALYAVGAIPVSLRAFVPEAVLDLGLAVPAIGIGWLAIWLFNRSSRISAWTTTSQPPQRQHLTV